MRRRLDLAVSFTVAPRVLFLDEPTTGLDPHGRNEVWQTIRALAEAGTTALLATQYLEEADRLAALTEVIRSLREEGITAQDIAVRRPTLDEAFRQLTGQAVEVNAQ